MRKMYALPVIGFSFLLVSCGNNQSADANKKTKTDSVVKVADSDKHDKLVRALVTDTNTNNFTDANGKKQGHWTITNETRQLPGYDAKAKIEEGDYKDGMKEGEWIEYNPNGSAKSRIIFKDDQPIK